MPQPVVVCRISQGVGSCLTVGTTVAISVVVSDDVQWDDHVDEELEDEDEDDEWNVATYEWEIWDKNAELHYPSAHQANVHVQPLDLWRKMSIYIVIPCLCIAGVNAWRLWGEHWEHKSHEPIEDRVEMPFMNIRTKNYFWGDGDKVSLRLHLKYAFEV